jgi:hypothetical protein
MQTSRLPVSWSTKSIRPIAVLRAGGGEVGKAERYRSRGRGFDFRLTQYQQK